MEKKMNAAEAAEAPAKVKEDAESFICPNCGGVIKYDITGGKFRCTSCKAESTKEILKDTVSEYDFSQYAEQEEATVAFEGVAVVHCRNCGCEITFGEFETATICPMCSSTQVATVKQKSGIPPEGIIPFKIDKIEAGRKFRAWVKSRWFAPNDFKKRSHDEGSLKGMYLPFWTYDASAVSTYYGEGGKKRVIKENDGKLRTEIDWKLVSGVVRASFDDVLVCATDKEKDIKGILPFNTVENTKPYSSTYLSGFHAELYSIKADKAFENAKKIMDEKLHSLALEDIKRNYDEASVKKLDTKHSNVTYKHLLLPIWGSVFGYKGKTYNYFVNGETGVVDGQRPYSVPKILLSIAGALAVLTLLVFVI